VTSTTYDVEPGPTDDPCAPVPSDRAGGDRERDLRRLAVEHTTKSVTVTMSMGAVRPRSTATYWSLHVHTARRAYEVSVSRYERGGDLEVSLVKAPNPPEPGGTESCFFSYSTPVIPCAGAVAKADTAARQVSVTLPRECLQRPRWVKVGAAAQSTAGPEAGGLLTILADFWGPRGVAYDGFEPPLSPRVRP
jgi:hypothetical protein